MKLCSCSNLVVGRSGEEESNWKHTNRVIIKENKMGGRELLGRPVRKKGFEFYEETLAPLVTVDDF